MADISTWSPVDESNVAAPPNGWPEFQPTNTVNNCGRAMMGAIRRWYDTITAQLSTLTTQITGMLPLTGGGLTGELYSTSNISTAASVIANANINAASRISAGLQYDLVGRTFATADASGTFTSIWDPGSGGQNITLYATGTNYYDNDEHQLRSRSHGAYAVFNFSGSYNVTGSWGVISDEAAKRDVAPYTRGLSAIQALRPVQYKYTRGPFAGEEVRYGLIAQDIQTIVPEMVGDVDLDGERFLTMQPGHLVWLLVNSCKELAARVEALEQR